MNIAIYGGAFDPIHFGHTNVAKAIVDTRLADEVIFVPAFNHCFGKSMAPYWMRVEFVAHAIEQQKGYNFSISYAEQLNLSGSTYEMVSILKSKRKANYSVVIGADNVNSIVNWRNYKSLVKENNFIIVDREKTLDNVDLKLIPNAKLCRVETGCVSSSKIKEAIKNKQDISGLVCGGLEKQMKELYE